MKNLHFLGTRDVQMSAMSDWFGWVSAAVNNNLKDFIEKTPTAVQIPPDGAWFIGCGGGHVEEIEDQACASLSKRGLLKAGFHLL